MAATEADKSSLSPDNARQVSEAIRGCIRPPQPCSLEDAVERLSSASTVSGRFEAALLTVACWMQQQHQEHGHGGGIEQDGQDHQHEQPHRAPQCSEDVTPKLVQAVAAKLLPLGHPVMARAATADADNRPHTPATTAPTNTDYKLHSLAAELGLFLLEQASLTSPSQLNQAHLLSIVAYTDSADPWTTDKAASMASRLLSFHLPADKLADFLTGPLLHAHLRPIFSNSSAKVTASGRPSQYNDQTQHQRPTLEQPSWKRSGLQTVTVFHWAVRVADAALLAKNWPLFVPVLVALAEDGDTSLRERGLDILVLFLGTCPARVIWQTGIGTVFEETVFPTLMFLPSLTPEQDSIRLLRVSYRALLLLADAGSESRGHQRRRLLDRALREGVLAGYHHASQHIRLVEVLMDAAAAIASGLGTFCTKHLQTLLPMVSAVMSDPFAMAYPPTLAAAAKALNVILANCWHRVSDGQHVDHLAHTIAVCWLNLHDDDAVAPRLSTGDMQLLSTQLAQTASLLQSVWANQGNGPPEKVVEALKQEPRLAKLFPALRAQ